MAIDVKKYSAAALLMGATIVFAFTATAHVDLVNLTDPCGSCHVGHGKSGQPMLAKAEEDFCYQCHGSDSERSRMMAEGRLRSTSGLVDMRDEFNKMYTHPVDREGEHSPTEMLPSFGGGEVGHAECVDCHNPHQRTRVDKSVNYEVKGYSLSGQYLDKSLYEYEVCLKCHTDKAGAKSSERSLVRAFASSARSQHPVTMQKAASSSPSLLDGVLKGGRMKCSDCHRSGDPDGPRGPHGSNHEFLLSGNYDRSPTARESSLAFEFCYGCHDRVSILNNESFTFHRQHIEGDALTSRPGTSCYTCHASHGSHDNPHLIQFNLQAVSTSKARGMIRYEASGQRRGSCVLECHGYDHVPGTY